MGKDVTWGGGCFFMLLWVVFSTVALGSWARASRAIKQFAVHAACMQAEHQGRGSPAEHL